MRVDRSLVAGGSRVVAQQGLAEKLMRGSSFIFSAGCAALVLGQTPGDGSKHFLYFLREWEEIVRVTSGIWRRTCPYVGSFQRRLGEIRSLVAQTSDMAEPGAESEDEGQPDALQNSKRVIPL